MFIFCTKEIAKDLKRKMRIWRVVQESMHIRGKAAYFLLYTVQIMLLMGFFNTLLLLTRDLLWKRTLSSKTKLSDRSSLDFPTIVYNMSNFRLGAWSWSANVDLHAFFNFLSH